MTPAEKRDLAALKDEIASLRDEIKDLKAPAHHDCHGCHGCHGCNHGYCIHHYHWPSYQPYQQPLVTWTNTTTTGAGNYYTSSYYQLPAGGSS